MAAEVKVDPNGLDLLLRRLDAGAARAADLMPAWPEVGRVWAERQRTVFEQGKGWDPLAPSTIKRKRKIGGGSKPLIRTGRLYAEATDPIPVRQNPHFAVFGIEAPEVVRYAHWHQRGAGVPKRMPVPRLTPKERKAMVKAIGDVIMEAIHDARA